MKKLLLSLVLSLFSALAFAVVNVNTASQSELESLSGIGPVKAKAIIDDRAKNGPFKSVEDLDRVKGIGMVTIEKLRKDISISGATSVTAAPAKSAVPAASAPASAAPAAAPVKAATPAPTAAVPATPSPASAMAPKAATPPATPAPAAAVPAAPAKSATTSATTAPATATSPTAPTKSAAPAATSSPAAATRNRDSRRRCVQDHRRRQGPLQSNSIAESADDYPRRRVDRYQGRLQRLRGDGARS